MFSLFFAGIQQDFKIALLPPLLCAAFRLIFILVYREKKTPAGEWARWYHCFRYGFWWGMDVNAYVFLALVLAVSLPGAFLPTYAAIGDAVRLVLVLGYALLLYLAFVGKMIFYYHYRDIFNDTLWLGRKAEKHNLLDIFLHQHHGGWVLLAILPYLALCAVVGNGLLGIPIVSAPAVPSSSWEIAAFALAVIVCTLLFYFIRYGGSLNHRDKPEWDEIPPVVKQDIFMARATVDDLVGLKLVLRRPAHALLERTDEEDAVAIDRVVPPLLHGAWGNLSSPLDAFSRTAKGARIHPPRQIFFLVGESYSQMPLDAPYADYHIMDAGKRFLADPHTASLSHFLPAGKVSRPAIVGLMSGIFDARLELNEREAFWRAAPACTLPRIMQRLGYQSIYWYGGSPTNGSMDKFAPAVGFRQVMGAVDFCPKDSPRTWVGVYDHIFLEHAAQRIEAMGDDVPTLHFVYTTTNHGPYTIPLKELGYDAARVMPDVPESVRRDRALQKMLGTYWYCDKATQEFIARMRARFPDALFVVTGDHAHMPIRPGDTLARRDLTLRETFCTSFALHHPMLDQTILAGNTIGGHMNILPTLVELIAPKGFYYASLFPPLTEPIDCVVTPYHWLTREAIGAMDQPIWQTLDVTAEPLAVQQEADGKVRFADEAEGYMAVTNWLVRHPECLEDA